MAFSDGWTRTGTGSEVAATIYRTFPIRVALISRPPAAAYGLLYHSSAGSARADRGALHQGVFQDSA